MMLSSLSARSPESAGTPLEEEREKMFIHSTEIGVCECFPKCEAIRAPCVCVCVCEKGRQWHRQRQSHSPSLACFTSSLLFSLSWKVLQSGQ